ncbi:1,4-alpha-glucan branching enzyme [Microbacteriaceae bacterium SG_E_30_P1]|uniref:1,4-alpha-glucan branching enzyme GlgB n=1 Tax=Antiquaquibacter oligotrophicus TaxID=2880260 RepID=A0ABT6KMZ9_9MICO|nr:1,4-alpha-glucan branching protein GlgB [Antiquaquibacter oligotrophicus]MDH6181387.1 1,4-alpha-glucan branching enzyme [Antiquaquibacter oligotrophicus]UDF12921.1 1,4-alpha-glucan branching protein GlgB [Antiquaquibacter oligotrophicus]
MPKKPVTLPELHPDHIRSLVEGRHPQPHATLGAHRHNDGWIIRAVRPLAATVTAVRADGTRVPLTHVADGLWEGFAPDPGQAYEVETTYENGPGWTADDPYRFVPSVGEIDLYLWGEGRHEQLWHVLGAHFRPHEGVAGTSFSVWAPHAHAARVIGDFNGWNGVGHAMRRLDDNGVWEIFIPGLEPGNAYKFELLTGSGEWVKRADPMARYTEVPPATASKIGQSLYEWRDGDWMTRRAASDPHNGAMSVYEVHLGSWRPGLDYRSVADELIGYVQELGFTHVEFLPLAEHPFGGSWGYQVTGYYAPTSRFGHPDDFKYLIDRLHGAGIGVIMDWVPGHFPKDEWALARFDGEALYEHSDPRRGEQLDWGTLIFNFGQSQVRNFLVANALYWLEEFHIDGLRVDAVASMLYLDYSREEGQWLPNQYGGRENLEAISFLQEVNATAYKRNPGIVMIAEESTSWPGVTKPTSESGLGFGMKWNMGWMHDTLQYMAEDPMYRSYHHGDITFSFLYAFSESFMLPISHDEVVHGKGSLLHKMPGDQWQKLANMRVYLSFMWAHPGKQLLFMGSEFGQPSEWSEERGLDWWILDQPVHQGLQRLVGELNRAYRSHPALWEQDNSPAGFEWIDGGNSGQNIVAFLRWSREGAPLVGIFNFSGNPVGPYRIGLPFAGTWREVINTDAGEFGGSGVGNYGAVEAQGEPWGGRPASVELTLPPLGGLWLAPA